MTEPTVSKVLKPILYALCALDVAVVATLPWTIDLFISLFKDMYRIDPDYRAFILVFLMVAGAIGLWLLIELVRMLHTIPVDPFVERNVRALRRLGFILLGLAALFAVKCAFYVTFLTVAAALLLVIVALFAFVLCSLFRQAVAYKLENELTI